MREVLSTRIWGVPPAWAVGSYSSGPLAGGTPQILVDKTSRMTGRLRVYKSYLVDTVVEALVDFAGKVSI